MSASVQFAYHVMILYVNAAMALSSSADTLIFLKLSPKRRDLGGEPFLPVQWC